MDNPKAQIAEQLKKANNILITVSRNPSIDQLSAAIGLTLVLNKLGKHAVAVYSGDTPNGIEFLEPGKTFEKNTDSLRDFIISLDKSKADKLRYKVQENMVKIFITPYKTTLSQDDLEFSQGDFNVEAVIALGVHEQPELDIAITEHGRILHDASVMTMNVEGTASIGSINWGSPESSSLSEMSTELSQTLKEGIIDNQVANAFLTGIVAETNRFSNEKTKPNTMQVSSVLMSAGANQQLVSNELQEASNVQPSAPSNAKKANDGSLEIAHDDKDKNKEEKSLPLPEPEEDPGHPIHINEHGEISHGPKAPDVQPPTPPSEASALDKISEDEYTKPEGQRRPMAMQPPAFGGKLTASTEGNSLDPNVDIIGAGAVPIGDRTTLSRDKKPLGQPYNQPNSPAAQSDNTVSQPPNTEQASMPPNSIEPVVDTQQSTAPAQSNITAPSQTQEPVSESPIDPVAATTPPIPPQEVANSPAEPMQAAQQSDDAIEAARNAVLQAVGGAPSQEPAQNQQETIATPPADQPVSDEIPPGIVPSRSMATPPPPPVPPPMSPPTDSDNLGPL